MKSFKPKNHEAVYGIMPGYSTNDLFMDVKLFGHFKNAAKSMRNKKEYEYIIQRLGKTVFVFDIDSCEFFERGEE